MGDSKRCVSWLQEYFIEDAQNEYRLQDIYSKYKGAGGDMSKISFSKYIRCLFKHVKVIKKRFNGVEDFAFGLKEKEIVNGVDTDPNDLTKVAEWTPSPFFVCKNQPDEVDLALFGDSINGNPTVNTIRFKQAGEWQLFVGNKEINLDELFIDSNFKCTKSSVQNVCNIVSKLRPCIGKAKENYQPDETKNKNYVVEFLGKNNTKIYRSKNCKKVVGFVALTSTCRNCQNGIRLTNGLPQNVLKVHTPKNNQTKEEEVVEEEEEEEENKFVLTKSNHEDMRIILEKVMPEASGEMLDLLVNQKQNLERNPKGRRWDKKTISLCLSLWCHSRKNYQQLRDSKVLILPSQSTLQLYKNCVDQQAGFHKDIFHWMKEEASKHYPSEGSFSGGICIDEMSIQEDLCMVKSNGEVRLIGFVDMGQVSENLNTLCTGKKERVLATHVLQFLYIGLNGFRFPFACFPVTQTKAGNLHFLFWEAVKFLNMYGFQVLFVSMDGAQTNRDFMKMFFSESSPLAEKFSTKNIWSPAEPEILFIMDYSHVIKRVRNNILKSGSGENTTRTLCYNQNITWDHWVNAFKWDRETNAFPLHRKLTHDHLYLSQESKMRNHLAEDVLNCEMLHLMQSFQTFLGDDGYLLDDTVALLRATSVIVSTFRDRRPIADIEDKRLDDINTSLTWFNDWEVHVNSKSLSTTGKEKQLMSYQTREDLNSCLIGFTQLCKNTLRYSRRSIVPARINSDVIENIFCQQRGIINGNNTNPTFYQYVKNVNAVIIGQNAVSKNSNAVHRGCEPLCFNTKQPLKRKRNSSNQDCVKKSLTLLRL